MSDLQKLPSRRLVNNFTEEFFEALLPMVASDFSCGMEQGFKNHLSLDLNAHIDKLLPDAPEHHALVVGFFEKLPPICRQLRADAELILQFDPAAYSLEEVLVTYPGFMAIAIHRVAHELYKLKVPILPRMMSEWAHSRTGIDINPGATIGHPFFIDHGTGVVIGETTIIGHNVKIYQGVTLGALNVRKEDAQSKRHPTIEDNVVIYANSTILGGNTTIGRESIIGGNTWITESIPPFSVVYHKQDQVVADRKDVREVINWVI